MGILMINISKEDAELFEKNGFSKEKVKATVEHYRQQGLTDEDIQLKINTQIANFGNTQPKTEPQAEQPKEVKRGVDLTPSGIAKQGGSALSALVETPFRMVKDNQSLPEAFKSGFNEGMETQEQMAKNQPIAVGSRDFITDMASYAALPVLRGGGAANFIGNAAIQGGVPGVVEGLKRGENPLASGGISTGIAGLLQGLPYAGKLLSKPANYVGKKIVEGLTDLKPETLEQVIKPNSQALDLTEDTAQNLLMNTTERLQNDYQRLLEKAGEDIQKAALNLPEERGVFVSSLKNALKDIYGGSQVSKNEALNPAMQGDKNIYDKVSKWIDSAENGVKLSAPEMYDLMTNIKRNIPIDWDSSTAKASNALKQMIYGDFARRLGNLSPELRAANKAYSDLAQFENNEGIRNILMPKRKGDIDAPSKVLRNYNSTVTKGNTNQNVQDLENILVKNGKQPFLNDINDVNAAMDLLTQPKTGRNFLGAQTLAKGLVVPALKAVRKANQMGIPTKLETIKDALAPINKLMPSLGAKGVANMLYGGVEYNDYK